MSGPTVALMSAVAVLFATGFDLMLQRSLIRIVVGFMLLGHGANLALLLAGGPAGSPPVRGGGDDRAMADPLPQAMALTAIVITFGVTAFLLALAYRSRLLTGEDEVMDDVEDRRVCAERRADPDTWTGDPVEAREEPAADPVRAGGHRLDGGLGEGGRTDGRGGRRVRDRWSARDRRNARDRRDAEERPSDRGRRSGRHRPPEGDG